MAAFVWVILCLMIAASVSSDSEGKPPKEFMLSDLCGTTVDVENASYTSGVFKMYNKKSSYRVDYGCFVDFKAPVGHRVLLKFVETEIDDVSWRIMECKDFVLVFDEKYVHKEDKDTKKPIATVILCGDNPPDDNYVSFAREMTIYFHTNVFATDEGYKMYFSAVHTGICVPGEFACDNGYCIDSSLKCNGYNNCGDESDMCPSNLPMILGIVFACAFVVMIVACCCYCRRKGSKYPDNKDKADTTETIPMNAPAKAATQPYPKFVPMSNPTRDSAPPPQSAVPPGRQHDRSKLPPPGQGVYPFPVEGAYPPQSAVPPGRQHDRSKLPPPGQGVYPFPVEGAYPPQSAVPPGRQHDRSKLPPPGQGVYPFPVEGAYPPPGQGAYQPYGEGSYPPARYSPSAHGYPSQQDVYPSAPPTRRDEYSPSIYNSPTQGYPQSSAYDRRV